MGASGASLRHLRAALYELGQGRRGVRREQPADEGIIPPPQHALEPHPSQGLQSRGDVFPSGQSCDDACSEVDGFLNAVLLGGSTPTPHCAAVDNVGEDERLNQQLLSIVRQSMPQLGQPDENRVTAAGHL